ncbi:hypothetical protein P3T33_004632 [Rhizobium sp. AN67]|nr:hypothetical protein [Rhizobium sp. AN67]SOD50360.1 hypothetical protein SAMN05216595_0124 [Rhizobium sp. AN6A]
MPLAYCRSGSVQFFPRTLFTIGFSFPSAVFANSLFWTVLQLSLNVLGESLAMAIQSCEFTDPDMHP